METNTKRAPVAAGSARRTAAKQRRTIAQKSCNHIARELELAYDGDWAVNCFRAGALKPLGMDLLHPLRLAKLRKDPRWRPPKGALEALTVFAMLVWRWHLPKTHARAGESGKSLLATNDIMSQLGGCSPDQWARYARPFLEYFDLIVGAPTTRARDYRGRDGQVIKAPEGRTLYLPGDALLELLGLRERRIERSRRALIAVARRQLANRDRKNSDPKALVLSFASQSSRTSRARGTLPLAHAAVLTYERPRRKVRPSAAVSSRSSTPAFVATSPATAGDPTPANSQRLVTKGASAGAAAGGELETQRQRAPVAPEAAQAPPEVPAPSPAIDATAAPPDAPVDEPSFVRGLLADFFAKTGGDRAAPSTSPAPSSGRQGSLPGKGVGVLLRTTQRRASQIADGLRAIGDPDAAPPASSPPRSPPPSPPPASVIGSLLGPPRSPAEREENERRRREALERARRESGDDDGGAT